MINAFLIGPSKQGKTYSLSTLPGAIIDFSFDPGGWHSIRNRNIIEVGSFREWLKQGVNLTPKDCLVINYIVPDMVEDAMYTRKDKNLISNFIQDMNCLWQPENRRGICHVVVDSLTNFATPVMEYILSFSSRMEPVERDWGAAIKKINEIITSLTGLPLDFIMTAHLQMHKDDLTGRIKEKPLIFGRSLPDIILSKFDEIFLTVVERGSGGTSSYLWATKPEGMFETVGCRNFDNLPPRVPQNFTQLFGNKLTTLVEEVKK